MTNASQKTRLDIATIMTELDPCLETFARDRRLSLSKNDHGWPNRRLNWRLRDNVDAQVEIRPDEDSHNLLSVYACAWKDEKGKRYGKIATVRKGMACEQLTGQTRPILEEAVTQIESWKESDFSVLVDRLENRFLAFIRMILGMGS